MNERTEADMIYVYPSYYFEFQCVGGNCPDTCCAGWKINIDDESLLRYRKYPGGFGNRLRNSVDFEEKSFLQYDHRCVLLNEKGLCDIQAEAGSRMLCRACARYPRHMEAYGDVREFSLNLSCPEAARLIFTQPKMTLRKVQRPKRMKDEDGLDEVLFNGLLKARDVLLQIIQNDRTDIRERMIMLLGLSHRLQRQLKLGPLSDMDNVYAHYLALGAGRRCRNYMADRLAGTKADRYVVMKTMFQKLHRLECVEPGWSERLAAYEKILYGNGRAAYEKMADWHMDARVQEQILAYFIYIYFAGAVYDGRPYVKVKLAVVSAIIIEEMLRACVWEKGRAALGDCIDAAHRFAREVEHSDENLYRMAEMLSKEKCFNINVLVQLNL